MNVLSFWNRFSSPKPDMSKILSKNCLNSQEIGFYQQNEQNLRGFEPISLPKEDTGA
jgi:hypothetical protein